MSAQPRSLPADRERETPPRRGAVLLLIYPTDTGLALPLTLRSDTVEHHKGQVSLPGGAWEEIDGSDWKTALRESQEEVGLDPRNVERLGDLSSLYIAHSHFEVHPFLGYSDFAPNFVGDPAEVAEILRMPLALILDPKAKGEDTRWWRERWTRIPYYRVEGNRVWGATAMILSELEALIRAEMAGS